MDLVYFQPSLPSILSCIWYGPRPVHTSLHTRAPESLHFAFTEAVDSNVCLLQPSAKKLTGLLQFLWKNLLASASLPLFYIPEDAREGSCLVTGGFTWPALSFCSLIQVSHPCHLQDSPKIVRGIPVGGTLFSFSFAAFLWNVYFHAWIHCCICMVCGWYIIKKQKLNSNLTWTYKQYIFMRVLLVSFYYQQRILTKLIPKISLKCCMEM